MIEILPFLPLWATQILEQQYQNKLIKINIENNSSYDINYTLGENKGTVIKNQTADFETLDKSSHITIHNPTKELIDISIVGNGIDENHTGVGNETSKAWIDQNITITITDFVDEEVNNG